MKQFNINFNEYGGVGFENDDWAPNTQFSLPPQTLLLCVITDIENPLNNSKSIKMCLKMKTSYCFLHHKRSKNTLSFSQLTTGSSQAAQKKARSSLETVRYGRPPFSAINRSTWDKGNYNPSNIQSSTVDCTRLRCPKTRHANQPFVVMFRFRFLYKTIQLQFVAIYVYVLPNSYALATRPPALASLNNASVAFNFKFSFLDCYFFVVLLFVCLFYLFWLSQHRIHESLQKQTKSSRNINKQRQKKKHELCYVTNLKQFRPKGWDKKAVKK